MLRRAIVAALAFGAARAFQSPVEIESRPKSAPKPDDNPRTSLRVDTTLVLVPVTVNDPLNRPVSGLEKQHFRLFEDKIPQIITHFAMDDEAVALGLVFDTSGSMGSKLQRSRMAAQQFFRTANPEDEFFLVEFDSAARLEVPLTRSTDRIEHQLLFSKSHGQTALLDAVYLALHEMKKSHRNKKALLVISDGGDNHSRYTYQEVRSYVRESDSLIYSIGVFGGGGSAEEMLGPTLMHTLAEQSGGQMYIANANELPDIAQKIGIELRNRYVLGYSPTNASRDGKYRKIQVQLAPPRGLPKGLRAHWRMGYYAPAQ